MFSFGFFSTHIPYLVFFFFYLTYFFYSYKSVEKKEFLEELIFGKKEVVVSADDQIEEGTFFYGQENGTKTPATLQNLEIPLKSYQLILGPGDRIDIAHLYEQLGLIVNRPPPFCI